MKILMSLFLTITLFGFHGFASTKTPINDIPECLKILSPGPLQIISTSNYFSVPRVVLVTGPAGSGKTFSVQRLLEIQRAKGLTTDFVNASFPDYGSKSSDVDPNTDVLVIDDVTLGDLDLELSGDLILDRFARGKSTMLIFSSLEQRNIGERFLTMLLDVYLRNLDQILRTHFSFSHSPVFHADFGGTKKQDQ